MAPVNPNHAIRQTREADARFCEGRILRWVWLEDGLVGQAECFGCSGCAIFDLSDQPRAVRCLDCRRSWTLKGYCQDASLPCPPSAIPDLFDPI